MSDPTGTTNSFANATQFMGVQVARQYGGEIGRAAASLLLGQPGLVASWANMLDKYERGELTGNDVADVFQDVASVLAGLGVLSGYANPWVLSAVGAAGLFNFVTRNYPAFRDLWDPAKTGIEAGYQVPLIISPQEAIANGWIDPNTLLPRIDPTGVNTGYHTATRTRPPVARDPLAIDLDGDGIETLGSATNPVLFDHNADGIRTGTGWVRPDDAWLVLDRNGDGLITSGRELFGVDTLLSGTPGVDAVYAPTGFAALAALDANADGVFNTSDAAFTQVRLWQDADQDGVSDAGELFSLADKGIASISLNATSTSINLGNGNTVSATATVTRANGSTTLAETVGVAAWMWTARPSSSPRA
jgi:hypothetical protein